MDNLTSHTDIWMGPSRGYASETVSSPEVVTSGGSKLRL